MVSSKPKANEEKSEKNGKGGGHSWKTLHGYDISTLYNNYNGDSLSNNVT